MLFCVVSVSCLGQTTQNAAPVRQYSAKQEEINQFRAERLKALDTHSRLSKAEHELLWERNITVAIYSKDDSLKIDAFGIAVTTFVDKHKPSMCAAIMQLVNDEVAGQHHEFSKLPELLLSIKDRVDKEWKKVNRSDFPDVLFRAELIDRPHDVGATKATWLLIDVHQCYSSHEDLTDSDLKSSLLRDFRGQVNPKDPDTQIVYKSPHPNYLAAAAFWGNIPALSPDRNQVLVNVVNDGFDRGARESAFGFKVQDLTKLSSHQIEGVYADRFAERDSRTQEFLVEAFQLFHDRMPDGTVLTADDLHLRVGSVAKVLHTKFRDISLVVTIVESKMGDRIYSKLEIDGLSL